MQQFRHFKLFHFTIVINVILYKMLSLFQIAAATCDFLSIVKELLQCGADGTIPDSDGCRPADVADSSEIKELLLNT